MNILPAKFDLPAHREAIVDLLLSYASDADSGGGVVMAEEARSRVVEDLSHHPTATVLLAEKDNGIVGMAVCFEGYSTFAAQPLLNLHDLVVHPDWRGQGVGSLLLEAVNAHAVRRGCVSITLEVIGANTGAQRLYRRHGFEGGQSITPQSAVMFWKKTLK